ncbi:MAG: hypothetical protein K9G62_04250 [Alphaproteobacteria bacterium]|nr:hypothetical protein [Alphaproteobacteria bacterium]
MNPFSLKSTVVPLLSLFLSGGTLICCALPALFVSLGMGAVLAGLVSNFPQLIWISAHKPLVFGVAGGILIIAGVMQWNARNLPCPADPAQARVCTRLRRISAGIYMFSVLVFLTGAFFAFGAKYLFIS